MPFLTWLAAQLTVYGIILLSPFVATLFLDTLMFIISFGYCSMCELYVQDLKTFKLSLSLSLSLVSESDVYWCQLIWNIHTYDRTQPPPPPPPPPLQSSFAVFGHLWASTSQRNRSYCTCRSATQAIGHGSGVNPQACACGTRPVHAITNLLYNSCTHVCMSAL